MRDIAALAGVSRTTVSHALSGQGRVNPDTRERVRSIAADLGFVRPTRNLAHLLWEVPLLMLASVLTAAAVGSLTGLEPSSATRSALNAPGVAVPVAVLLALSTVLVLPLAEEILWRRLVFDWLRARLPAVAAVVATGLLFGLSHVAPPVLCYVIPWGIGVTALRAWHGTLWASLAAHVTNNAVVTAVVLSALG